MGAIQVTSSRKGAKSRTHGYKSRLTGTKAETRVSRLREPRAELGTAVLQARTRRGARTADGDSRGSQNPEARTAPARRSTPRPLRSCTRLSAVAGRKPLTRE